MPSSTINLSALLQLIRFDRPIGTLLLLWPTLTALWLAAGGTPDMHLLLIFTLGTFLMRSAGCVINDLADRDFDGDVERTCNRPLVTGAVSPATAWIFALVLALISFGLVLMTNKLTVLLSVGGVILAACYPFMKRYTHLPQVVLGAAFSWGIPMAFAAQSQSLPAALWLLYFANLLWTVAYDTEYAMVDRNDDLRIGIKSTAILFGRYDRLIIALLQCLALCCLGLTGIAFELGLIYWLALFGVATSFGWQHYLMRDRDRSACFNAFLNNNYTGMLFFGGVVLDFLLGS